MRPSLQALQQSWKRWAPVSLPVALMAVLGLPLAARAKQASQTMPGINTPPSARNNGNFHNSMPEGPMFDPNKLEHMREDERRKRLVADTDKLISLSNELKSDLDKSSRDELSLDVVRKAAEIEKLAHDVKERMKS